MKLPRQLRKTYDNARIVTASMESFRLYPKLSDLGFPSNIAAYAGIFAQLDRKNLICDWLSLSLACQTERPKNYEQLQNRLTSLLFSEQFRKSVSAKYSGDDGKHLDILNPIFFRRGLHLILQTAFPSPQPDDRFLANLKFPLCLAVLAYTEQLDNQLDASLDGSSLVTMVSTLLRRGSMIKPFSVFEAMILFELLARFFHDSQQMTSESFGDALREFTGLLSILLHFDKYGINLLSDGFSPLINHKVLFAQSGIAKPLGTKILEQYANTPNTVQQSDYSPKMLAERPLMLIDEVLIPCDLSLLGDLVSNYMWDSSSRLAFNSKMPPLPQCLSGHFESLIESRLREEPETGFVVTAQYPIPNGRPDFHVLCDNCEIIIEAKASRVSRTKLYKNPLSTIEDLLKEDVCKGEPSPSGFGQLARFHSGNHWQSRKKRFAVVVVLDPIILMPGFRTAILKHAQKLLGIGATPLIVGYGELHALLYLGRTTGYENVLSKLHGLEKSSVTSIDNLVTRLCIACNESIPPDTQLQEFGRHLDSVLQELSLIANAPSAPCPQCGGDSQCYGTAGSRANWVCTQCHIPFQTSTASELFRRLVEHNQKLIEAYDDSA